MKFFCTSFYDFLQFVTCQDDDDDDCDEWLPTATSTDGSPAFELGGSGEFWRVRDVW